MINLNDILESKAEFHLRSHHIEYELILGEGFPNLDDKTSHDYFSVFGELYGEIVDVRPLPTKVRITSKLEDELQIVCIEHNGNQLRKDILDWLNRNIERVEKGEPTFTTPGKHGNLRAAKILKPYGGTIRLSNIHNGEYHIQTKVEIPIPTSTHPNS